MELNTEISLLHFSLKGNLLNQRHLKLQHKFNGHLHVQYSIDIFIFHALLARKLCTSVFLC